MANGAIATDDSAWCTLNLKTVSLLEKHRLRSLRADRRRPVELPTSSADWLEGAASLKVRDMLP